jgi:hypothetical protein
VRDGLRLLAELPDDDLETMLGVLRRAADLNAGHAERVRNSLARPPRG